MRTLLLLLLLSWQLRQLGQPGQALAHAALLEAVPADGSALDVAPAEMRLRFDEPVTLIALTLAGPGGPVNPARLVVQDGDSLLARFPADLPPGTYLLSWRVTSVDSHPVFGTIAFGIGRAPDAARPQAEGQGTWFWPAVLLRWAFLLALLVTAGGAAFRAVAPVPRRVETGLRTVALLGVGLAGLQLGVRGALLADAPTLLAAGPWTLGAGTTLATGLLRTAVGLLGCAFSRGATAGGIWAVIAVLGLTGSGHAATADPQWLMGTVLALHLVAGAAWIGALWPLLALLRDGGTAATDAVRRFSVRAVPAVGLLLASGTVLAAVQLRDWHALTATDYGRLLLLKLAFVALLLALAVWNRQRLTPLLAAGHPKPLRRSIRAELVFATAVLAATALLGLTPPPRAQVHVHAQAPASEPGHAVWTQAEGIGALVEIAPARPGRNAIALTIDRPAPPKEVWLELRQNQAGVAAIRRPMRLEAGRWIYEGPEMALPGRWTLRAEALLTDYQQTTFTTEVDLP